MPHSEELLFKELSYQLVGLCMEIHRILGHGHLEAVYKDALEYELTQHRILFSREQNYRIKYKGRFLPHRYYADFVVQNAIIVEVKAVSELSESHIKQTLNYLAASKLRLGLLINFGQPSLMHRRIIL